MKQPLSTVNFCHEYGIMLSDLKPENILIESEEESKQEFFSIKVIDFGTSDPLERGIMFEGQKGTPFYTASEVTTQKYNEKCDLWSCGFIMYIFLCGVPPFYGETEEEIYINVKRGIVEYSEEELDNVSSVAKDLINKLLVKILKKDYQ